MKKAPYGALCFTLRVYLVLSLWGLSARAVALRTLGSGMTRTITVLLPIGIPPDYGEGVLGALAAAANAWGFAHDTPPIFYHYRGMRLPVKAEATPGNRGIAWNLYAARPRGSPQAWTLKSACCIVRRSPWGEPAPGTRNPATAALPRNAPAFRGSRPLRGPCSAHPGPSLEPVPVPVFPPHVGISVQRRKGSFPLTACPPRFSSRVIFLLDGRTVIF